MVKELLYTNMENIIYENSNRILAPKNGKLGYIINGVWYEVDPKTSNPETIKREIERYKQLRGKEQFEKDKKAVELLRQKDNKPTPKKDTGYFFDGAKGGKYDTKPTQTQTQTQAPAPKPDPKPAQTSDKKYQFTVGDKSFNMTKADINKTYRDPKSLGSIDPVKFGRAANQAIYKFKKPGPNPLMKMYKQPSVEEAYEVVLDYLLSEGHAETLEEANYVMMQLDAEYIQSIVEMGMPSPIDPIKHKAAQKTQKIYNKAKGGAGSEKDFLKRTGPQLPGV